MSFFDFNPFNGFMGGPGPGDLGIDQPTKIAMEQMSKGIFSLLDTLQTNQTGAMATLRNSMIKSIGTTKESMVLSLNNSPSTSSASGSAGASAGAAISGVIAGIVASLNSLSAEIEQINYTSGQYIADTIGRTEYISQRLGQMVGEYLDAGGKVGDLQVWENPTLRNLGGADEIIRGGKDVLTELGRSIQKAGEAEAAAIFGGIPQISLLAGVGLGAVIASVLTIPGDTAQITQEQVDAALAQYQLEQDQEIQEKMGNLEENVLNMVDNTNEFLISDKSKAYDLINGVISGAITDWRAGIGELVSDWLLHGATVYDSSTHGDAHSDGSIITQTETFMGMLSRGLF